VLSRLALPVGGLGLGLGVSSLVVYAANGYDRTMLLLWLGGLLVVGASLLAVSERLPRIARADVLAPAAALVGLAPLYLAALYEWPVQVDSDELAVMQTADIYADEHTDPFGASIYYSRPTLLFIVWGNLGQLFGGIELSNMRLLHALVGLLSVAVAYVFFRQLLPLRWALFATCVLGSAHSLFMISRLAMRENTALLAEVAALALLILGLRYDHAFASFCGGIAAGLGYYVYYPGRAAFPLWVLFLVGLALWYRSSFRPRRLATAGAVAAVGFALAAGPILIAESKLPPGVVPPNRETLLIYPEARQLQQQWVFADSEWEGFKENVSFGLTTFNSNVVDHSWIYDNHGHGFVDPLTGILLWVGIGVVLVALFRRRAPPWALLSLGGFLGLWLAFAFLVNKAPNYTRLLITLPFVAYFVTEAVRFLAGRTKPWVERWSPARAEYAPGVFAALALTALVAWNLAIAWDFVQQGRRNGDPIGSTGRYIESHRTPREKRFYLAADDTWKYYDWQQIDQRLIYFAHDGQVGPVVSPSALHSFEQRPPFALFMNRDLFAATERDLKARYPRGRVEEIVPDGRLVVFEVPS
jgi:Dolichyl-phosphate-mannose-protein mannosyltransferase